MRKQMNSKKHVFTKATAFVLICCVIGGTISIPSLAEETISLHNMSDKKLESNQSDIGKDKAQVRQGGERIDTGKGTEASKQDGEGTDTEQETEEPKQNGERTGTGQDTEASRQDGEETGIDQDTETSKQDGEGTDTEQETEEPKQDGEGTDIEQDREEPKQDDTGTGSSDASQEVKKDEDGTGTGSDNAPKNEESVDTGKKTVSGNDVEDVIEEKEKETVSGNDIGESEKEEQEIIDVVVPSAYILALNPYCLPIRTGEDDTTTKQVISGNYGIVNKSSTDQIVTVSLTVEDDSGEELVFVDSAEEAENAGMHVYAIYLAAVPANEEQILIGDEPVDGSVTAKSLQNVRMTGADNQAVTLYAGMNQISFKLSKAVYDLEAEEEAAGNLNQEQDEITESEEKTETIFQELAADGQGVTAYTFSGVMNPNAEWEKLSGGIKLSVVYTYQTADGDEEIVEGTGAMVSMDEIFA